MSRHMGRLTKMKTLNSMRTEKQRKMAYRTRQARPSRQSRVHLLRWTPRTCVWDRGDGRCVGISGGTTSRRPRGDLVTLVVRDQIHNLFI